MNTLINWETGELNVEAFKKIVPKLEWVKKERKIGNLSEMWYLGTNGKDDEERTIKVVVRPTMRAQITESYKNRLSNGAAPKKGQKPNSSNPFVDYGCSCQVLVDDKFLEKIDKLAKDFQKKPMQKLSWG